MTIIEGCVQPGSIVLDFNKLTPGALSSLRYMLETEATKNPDYEMARYCFEACRAIHEVQSIKG